MSEIPHAQWRESSAFPCAVAAALAVIAYFGVWRYGYASDDVALVVRYLRDGWVGVAPLLSPRTGAVGSGGYEAYFRPAWVLMETGTVALFGPSPFVSHLVSYVLFVCTVALMAYLVTLVTEDSRIALWAGAVFALQPIHSMNVAWISGRTDLIATFGVVGALVAIAQHGSGRSTRTRGVWVGASLVFALIGLAGKEMAYLLPLLAFVTEWTRGRIRGEARPVARAAIAAIPVTALTVAWAAFVLVSSSFVSGFAWAVGAKTVLMNWVGAVTLLFAPVDYEWMLGVALGSRAVLICGIAMVLVVGAALGWYARREPVLLWGLLWIGIGILPLYRLTMRWYLLLPSVGAAIVVGTLIRRGEQTRYRRWATAVGALVLIAHTTALSVERSKWHTADIVAKDALASLVRIADAAHPEHRFVAVSSPFKARRMPVFGGNTESFLRVATGHERDVDVIAGLNIERDDVSVAVEWISAQQMCVAIVGEGASFQLSGNLNARGRASVGERFAVECGDATIVTVNAQQQPTALDVALDHAPVENELWVGFDGREFRVLPIPTHALSEISQ